MTNDQTASRENEEKAGGTTRGWTPGPWNVGPRRASKTFVEVCDFQVALLCDGSDKQRAANAHLIAAAPEMYEALKALERALRSDARQKTIIGDDVEYHLDGQTMYQAINKARTALAKAIGAQS